MGGNTSRLNPLPRLRTSLAGSRSNTEGQTGHAPIVFQDDIVENPVPDNTSDYYFPYEDYYEYHISDDYFPYDMEVDEFEQYRVKKAQMTRHPADFLPHTHKKNNGKRCQLCGHRPGYIWFCQTCTTRVGPCCFNKDVLKCLRCEPRNTEPAPEPQKT